MKNEELELFYRLDEKKYVVESNFELQEWLDQLGLLNHQTDIQNFINKLAGWYFVKYPDHFFCTSMQDKSCELSNQMAIFDLFQRFSLFEKKLFEFGSQNQIEFCQYLFQLAGFEMIYSKKSYPQIGFARAKLMFHEFNACFQWQLDTSIYEEIMNRDYSSNSPDIINLLKEQKERQKEHKKKKLRLSRFLHR